MSADSTLTCRDCGQHFIFTAREQDFYATRGFDNPPGRCPDCRAARKAERGGADRASSDGNRGAREMFSATCAGCGKEAQVPFQPSGDRPVYCSDCYQEHRIALWRSVAWACAVLNDTRPRRGMTWRPSSTGSDGNVMSAGGSNTRCRQCRKPIIWPGLCYTCATGLPRQLRPRQHTAEEGPMHTVAASDQPGPDA